MSDPITERDPIGRVTDPSIPIPERHRLADEISLTGDQNILFSFKEQLRAAGQVIPRKGNGTQQLERKFLSVTIGSLRMFSKGRGIKI